MGDSSGGCRPGRVGWRLGWVWGGGEATQSPTVSSQAVQPTQAATDLRERGAGRATL